ncbi:UAP56-interacting factor-like isoform X2 [Mixophyes fleayi]|uniref:UAP56-interacting factor-like isoform X2 n=1 Tax=Mixophyes fleayi TaxID=3061075 RepID=UPI003F4DD604
MEEEQSQTEVEFQEGNKKIDMSLDDIIKLQREESGLQSSLNQPRLSGRTRSSNFRNKAFFTRPPTNQRGPGRPRPGFKQQRYSNVTYRNNSGPVTRRRAAASLNGVSPLNRPSLSTLSSEDMGQPQTQKGQQNKKKYRATTIPVHELTRRINIQNRKPQLNAGQRQQRTNAVNRNRKLIQQVTMNRGKRQLNARRWQNNKDFGSTLTVSVPNPKASPVSQPTKAGMKRPGGRLRKTTGQPTGPIPKGVPLRFNFRAMANHTNVTLNQRFSSLKIKGQYTTARGRGRTVMLT